MWTTTTTFGDYEITYTITKNEQRIFNVEKTLPEKIGTFISQVEFAQDNINKK